MDQVVVYQATGGKEQSGDPSSGGMETSPDGLRVNAANGNNAYAYIIYISFRWSFTTNIFSNSTGAATQSKPVPKTVIAGIVAASILGFVTVLVIIVFLVSQCRRRRALNKQLSEPSTNADSPVLPIQDPDLEAGPYVFEEKKVNDGIKRSTSRFTVKSFASRWSQSSFSGAHAPYDLEAPPVPPVPRLPGLPSAPKLILAVPGQELKRSPSTFSSSTGSATLHSNGDDDSVLDGYYYRNSASTTSTNTVSSDRDGCFESPR